MTCINTKKRDQTLRRLKRTAIKQIFAYEDQARQSGHKMYRRRRRTPPKVRQAPSAAT